ncbi:MAG: DASS family sodium-coupled anion symporter [Bryobacteraceae bacterium]
MAVTQAPVTPQSSGAQTFQPVRMLRGFALLAAVYALVVYGIHWPASIKPEGPKVAGLFLATIVGSVIEPIPAAALVLIAVTLAGLTGVMTMGQALAGYSDGTVWLVMTAFFLSRGLINTGLARRIALNFVRLFGRTSLGVCYSLGLSDFVLAGMIPANGARAGGVIRPIGKAIAEIYGSTPGPTASKLGSYLYTAVYQSVCVSTAMFYTGQASNPLAARFAAGYGYNVTWLSWFVAAIVPGAVSLAVIPWITMKLNPPEIKETPEAADFAKGELRKMGPMARNEHIVAAVFTVVCSMWVSSSWTKVDITATALLGGALLLVTGVLSWEDIKSEKAAWDVFIWFGGLFRLGSALNDAGVTRAFADGVAMKFGDLGWPALFGIALVIYYYAHYGFASITSHMVSMFPPFLAVLLAKGAPPGLVVYGFACFTNLAAALTHFGTTPGPIFYADGYVTLKEWWKVGAVISVVNLIIWTTIGFGYWKLIGIW